MKRKTSMDFRHGSRDEPEINLIPFIDVLLVILIFLMLSTTYSKFTEMQLRLPVADAEAQRDYPKEIIVSVSSDGRYVVNKTALPERGVEAVAAALGDLLRRSGVRPPGCGTSRWSGVRCGGTGRAMWCRVGRCTSQVSASSPPDPLCKFAHLFSHVLIRHHRCSCQIWPLTCGNVERMLGMELVYASSILVARSDF